MPYLNNLNEQVSQLIVCLGSFLVEEQATIKLEVPLHGSGRKMAELQNPKNVENEWEHAGHDFHELKAQEFTVHLPGQPFAKP